MSIKPFQNENLNIDNDNDDVLKAINIKQAREKYEKSIIRRKSSLLISSSGKRSSIVKLYDEKDEDFYKQFIRRSSNVPINSLIQNDDDDNEFKEESFLLPKEELVDLHEYERYQTRLFNEKQKILKRIKDSQSIRTLTKLDNFNKLTDESIRTKGKHESKLQLKIKRSQLEGKLELNTIKHIVKYRIDKNNLLNEDAIHDISTLDHPKIDSLEEKLEDLRQEEVEKWCFRRGKKPAYKLLNKEKRQLRKWFKEIDVDGSGEVTAVELEDALLSSGIFKTREQVHRVLSNIDKNQTNGIDFEEFLIALQSNTIAKDSNKLKRLQEMSSNELGFSMDTLLTEERRFKFLKSIFYYTAERQLQYAKTIAKIDNNKRNQREHEKLQKDLLKLEEKQEKTLRYHDKYIEALENVVIEKLNVVRNMERENNIEFNNKVNILSNIDINSNSIVLPKINIK